MLLKKMKPLLEVKPSVGTALARLGKENNIERI